MTTAVDVLNDRERPFQAMCARVALDGFRLDPGHIKAKIGEFSGAREQARQRVAELTGGAITNPSSTKDVPAALTAMGVPLGGTSAAKDVLGKVLADNGGDAYQHAELLKGILEYRHDVTTLGLLLEPLDLLCERGDGRMRPTVYTINADTGRTSCVRPNGQQFSRQGGIRACVIADPGYAGISADFSGVEIRVGAALSGDTQLLEAELSTRCQACGQDPCNLALCGKDQKGLHWMAARMAWGPEATKENRYAAKRIIFSKMFGGSPKAGAAQTGVTWSAARAVHDAFEVIAARFTQWDQEMRAYVDAGGRAYQAYSGRTIWLPKGRAHAAGNYCLAPDTPVLRSDLRYVPASELRPGDRLVAFDENRLPGNQHRRMRTAVVEAASTVTKPSVRVLAGGKVITCSTDHLWLTRRRQLNGKRGRYLSWVQADELSPGDELLSIGTWTEDTSRTAGWLAGLYDGEGNLQICSPGQARAARKLEFAQLPGPVMEAFCKGMAELGLAGTYREATPGNTSRCARVGTTSVRLIMQVLGTLQPVRFHPRYEELWEDISVTAGMTESVQVDAVVPAGDRVLASVQTSTRTLIADGFLSHNCIQGTARELLVDGALRWSTTRWGRLPVLPIHDELLTWVPEAEAAGALSTLVACMKTELYGVRIDAAGSGPFPAWPDSS